MKTKELNRVYIFVSFILPALILGIIFVSNAGLPFVPQRLFQSDLYVQYYPFLSDYRLRVREGGSLLWSWTHGGGTDYFALWAYYLTSPFNLILIIMPHSFLPYGIIGLILTKIGLASAFMCVFLSKTNNAQKPLLPVFSTFYALCGFAIVYNFNILWLDSFALLPLVTLGVYAYINEGKFKLYVIALALSLFTNFHFALYTCIFVVFAFFGQCIVLKMKTREVFCKTLGIAGYSAIAVGLNFFLLLGVYSSAVGAATRGFSLNPGFYHSYMDILGNFAAFSSKTVDFHIPALYTGMLPLMLCGAYLSLKRVSIREKAVFITIAAIILLACNFNYLDYIFNGFYFPRGLYQRYIFLLSFVIIGAAYKAYLNIDDFTNKTLGCMLTVCAIVLFTAYQGIQAVNVLANIGLCAGYLLLLWLYISSRSLEENAKKHFRTGVLLTIVLVMLTELYISTDKINKEAVNLSLKKSEGYAQVQRLLQEIPNGADYARVNFDVSENAFNKFNNTSYYGYNGIEFYSSVVNPQTAAFLSGLGLFTSEISLNYNETTPIINAFFNGRYLLSFNRPADYRVFWRELIKYDGVLLYENQYPLPLGFMVSENILDYAPIQDEPFASQNRLFSLATGINADVLVPLSPSRANHNNYTVTQTESGAYSYEKDDFSKSGHLSFTYQAPELCSLYAYSSETGNYYVSVHNGSLYRIPLFFPDTFPLGCFSENDMVTVEIMPFQRASSSVLHYSEAVRGELLFTVVCADEQTFAEGYALLADETLNLTDFKDTYVKGDITVKESGLLYLSVPYKNRWKAYVNGKRADIIPIADCMTGIRLEPGIYEIELKYYNTALTVGACVSVLSLFGFVLLILKKGKKNE